MAKTTVKAEAERLDKRRKELDELLHLRHKAGQLESQNEKLHRQLGSQKELVREVKSAVLAADPFPRFYFKRSQDRSRVAACFAFSDWQIGEQINKDETEGFGQFNYKIAEARIFYIVNSFLDWIETQRSAYRIDECAIAGIGDYISGDIHRELSVTNEFPVPVQTAKAGLLFGECLRRIAPHFKTVTVFEVGADNHGRLNPKPQFKQKAANNMSHLVHVIANAHVERCQNITPVMAQGIKYLANIAGKKFLIEHGDTVKAWMGVPYYGMEREAGREARRRMGNNKGLV